MADVTKFSGIFATMAIDYSRASAKRRTRVQSGVAPAQARTQAETVGEVAIRVAMERALTRRLTKRD